MLSEFSHLPIKTIKQIIDNGRKYDLYEVVRYIATYMCECIIKKDLKLKPIKYFTIIDGMNKKERIIGVEEPLHQMFDYVAVKGMLPMLNAKIGIFQCASMPKKGQSYGKKYIEKWVKEKKTAYYVKGDIKKCFPSIPIHKLKRLLKRDIKDSTLLWLAFTLLDKFEYGLSIGSFLSQYLCNYYLSYAYHYASEQLFKIRNTKYNGSVRVRLINHVLFYMDDFLLTSSSKKDLRKGMNLLIEYFNDFLELEVKPKWKVCRIDSEPIDMMGFVFRKGKTTIRAKIFLKIRRYFLKARKRIKNKKPISEKLAFQCVSGYGWFKNTDSQKVRNKLNIDFVDYKCKKVISYYAIQKLKGVDNNANIRKYKTTYHGRILSFT